MSAQVMRNLARRLARIERQLKQLRQPQLQTSSIEDGAVEGYTIDDEVRVSLGKQFDGTWGAFTLGGPVPPQSTAPIVTAVSGGLNIKVDGDFVGGAIVPMDFSRFDIVASTDPDFDPIATPPIGAISSPRGGTLLVSLSAVPWTVAVVVRSTSGQAGLPSDKVTRTPKPGGDLLIVPVGGIRSATTNVDSDVTIPHTLGQVPVSVSVTPQGPVGIYRVLANSMTATNFQVRCYQPNGNLMGGGQAVDLHWQAFA